MKIYKANDNLSFPLIKGGKVLKYASFSEIGNTYWTSDKNEIEILDKAAGSLFHLHKVIDENSGLKKKSKEEAQEYEEILSVKSYQEAKEYLRSKFTVSFQALGTPKAINRYAKEKGIIFPNIKISK